MLTSIVPFEMDEFNATNRSINGNLINGNLQASANPALWRKRPTDFDATDSDLELIMGIYGEEEISKWVLKALERLQREHALALISTAVLVKHSSGQLQTRQIVDWNLVEEGLIDGITAAIVALFNPVGTLKTVPFNAGGLAVEVLVENLAELGLTYEELKTFSKSLKPCSSVLMALTRPPWKSRLMVEMAHTDARLIHKPLLPGLRTQLDEHFINLAKAVTHESTTP